MGWQSAAVKEQTLAALWEIYLAARMELASVAYWDASMAEHLACSSVAKLVVMKVALSEHWTVDWWASTRVEN